MNFYSTWRIMVPPVHIWCQVSEHPIFTSHKNSHKNSTKLSPKTLTSIKIDPNLILYNLILEFFQAIACDQSVLH